MQHKPNMMLVCLIAVLAVAGAGAFIFAGHKAEPVAAAAGDGNVKVDQGKEIIEISAKDGYTPRLSLAKANLPVVLKINTNSTFDCSAVLAIPSINYHARLPLTGITTVEIPPQKPGTELDGICSMGMYGFKIKFAE